MPCGMPMCPAPQDASAPIALVIRVFLAYSRSVLLFIANANIFHAIGSSRPSEPYTDLSNTIGRISVKIIIVAIL